MIVGVTGSRDWADAGAIRRGMAAAQGDTPHPDMLLIHGKCPPRTESGAVVPWGKAAQLSQRVQLWLRGADWLASVIAAQLGWQQKAYPAHWKLFGAQAGFARNTDMVNESGAELWLAFIGACQHPGEGCPATPHGSHGGQDCLDKVAAAGLPYVADKRGW